MVVETDCDKDSYASPGEAQNAARRLHQVRRNRKIRLRIYRCERCRYWHLTSKVGHDRG